MNKPTDAFVLEMLVLAGASSLGLSGSSIGLIAGPFTPARNLTVAGLTEANFDGYSRKALGTPSITFVGADGNDYLQSIEVVFTPSGSATPNTIYGYFITFSSDSTKLAYVEPITPNPILNGPTTNLTIVPRFGQVPTINWGNGVVSD